MDFDWTGLLSWQGLANLIDILIVWFLIFQLLRIARKSRAINILNGVLFILLIKIISTVFHLETIDWIMDSIIRWSVVGVLIIFQPEIRRGLEHLGQQVFIGNKQNKYSNPSEKMVGEIIDACKYMGKRRIGALISIQKNQPLDDYAATGISMDSKISSQLLINIFIPNTPLHDGAVIIQDLRISSAASYLPLSENPNIPKELGTRHRAAVGLSEASDSLTVVVSEETGNISIAEHGEITRDLNEDELYHILSDNFIVSDDNDNNFFTNLFQTTSGEGDDNE
ncbi:diadenylate cyclase CdaA [Aerococcus kribbianus]|uniref:Diadenylate cyclase n=1 Tax=Aerococcus kribbianus TaxID=2999064 RepID=A0A9X3FWJ8_9LACT|nr:MULTISPECIES: diadenylate cyclase CdaA [unclassified Aerococcus]MCZ0717554.1 diadenylate cyclase CdaA [Aerococcus sp. YH-aer221]MCZ0725842.1 diadenylate cyclase CdaA [Aerococcus sp. YH-aer222]